jgi:hypothetical protein
MFCASGQAGVAFAQFTKTRKASDRRAAQHKHRPGVVHPGMITLTRTSEPEADFTLFTIERDGQTSLRLTRSETIARLTMFEVDDAERLVEQAAVDGRVIIHEHG